MRSYSQIVPDKGRLRSRPPTDQTPPAAWNVLIPTLAGATHLVASDIRTCLRNRRTFVKVSG
jgi:hypothetical protein